MEAARSAQLLLNLPGGGGKETEMIEKDMKISDLLEEYEEAGPLLAQAGLPCVGCAAAGGETIEEAALEHGLDPVLLLRKLNLHLLHRI